MQPIRIKSNLNNIDVLNNLKTIKNFSNTNYNVENINQNAVNSIENIDFSLNAVNNKENISIAADLAEKYGLSSEQCEYIDKIFATITDSFTGFSEKLKESKELQEKFKANIEALLEQDILAAQSEGRAFTFADLIISLTGKKNTTIASIAAKSDMDLSTVAKIYDLVDKNGMTLEYGTLTVSDGWYTTDFDYNGLYAKYTGDNGYSYTIALSKIDETSDGVVYSSYSDEELTRYVEGCNSYIEHVQDIANNDLTDFFKSQVSSSHIKDSDGNISICIVDVKSNGLREWAGVTCNFYDTEYSSGTAINGGSILDAYDPANGKIITNDSRIVGTFIHELGHTFDNSFINTTAIQVSWGEEWENIYPQIVAYMKEINTTSVEDGDARVQLGDSVVSIVSYSDQIVGTTNEGKINDLSGEIFTEMNRLYYQDPATLQAIEIEYTNEETGVHFDNLYDFLEAIENGRLSY